MSSNLGAICIDNYKITKNTNQGSVQSTEPIELKFSRNIRVGPGSVSGNFFSKN